jgi:hypothetical protein
MTSPSRARQTACFRMVEAQQASPRYGLLPQAAARKALGWPKRCKFVHAFLWEYSYKRL